MSDAETLPILPLRNAVLFPLSVVPINVGRPRSVRLVEELAERSSSLVGVLSQADPDVVEPTFTDLLKVGTLARVVKVIRLGPTNYSVVLSGVARFRLEEGGRLEPFMQAPIIRHDDPVEVSPELLEQGQQLRAMMRRLLSELPAFSPELLAALDNVRQPGALADVIAANLPEEYITLAERQAVLQAMAPEARLALIEQLVAKQLEVLRVRGEVHHLVQEELSQSQRDYALRQQLRLIREELGENVDDDELEQLRERIARAELPEEAFLVARKQLSRMSGMQQQSAEYQLTRNYVEWLADLPWNRTTPDRLDVREVRRCLGEDHYGLEDVKKRIVEYSAIRQLRRDQRGPILLFVGPPGVGKTSLGRSIARAMGRRYARVALGAVRDEAEVRGHRRTYVGALPGRILQALKKVGTKNPVLVLDEIDKLGADVRGDPAAALLEVLDPAQNGTFQDHYIDLPFDLSQVTFLATANTFRDIPEALRDRLEVIEVPGYTRVEKREIAKQFLVPKQLKEHGLGEEHLAFTEEGIDALIDAYTREAGVRGLEREIAAVCREVSVRLAEGRFTERLTADPEHLEAVLGPARYRPELTEGRQAPGVALGLAHDAAGGALLFVEATQMPGHGNVQVTGKLHDVMKEAASAAVALVRARAERLLLPPDWLSGIDLHVHIPRARGALDAAAAGLPIFVAVASLLLRAPTHPEVAVVGELTLRGKILPVHGIVPMLLGAHRAGVREVVLPERNRRDLEELPADVRGELRLHFVAELDQVLPLLLAPPAPGPTTDEAAVEEPTEEGPAEP